MIRALDGVKPQIHASAYIHKTALVIGKVTIGKNASIWPYCVLRGDIAEITIGEETNIQDNTVIHTNKGLPALLGEGISVGHGVILHGCKVQDHCIIGMGSILLDGSVVGENSIIAAGAVVSPNNTIPKGSMAMGIPAKVTRPLRPDELEHIHWNAKEYLRLSQLYSKTYSRVRD